MAITPPSDIVLDVLNAADPARLDVAQARLASAHELKGARELAATDKGFDATLVKAGLETRAAALDSIQNHMPRKDVPESYRKFEAMVLQSFVKSMLPSDSEAVFGKGVSGEMWRGMMAEQLGDALAKGGGIGIAETLARGGKEKLVDKQGHVTLDLNDNRVSIASQVMAENQLKALDKLLPGDHAKKG